MVCIFKVRYYLSTHDNINCDRHIKCVFVYRMLHLSVTKVNTFIQEVVLSANVSTEIKVEMKQTVIQYNIFQFTKPTGKIICDERHEFLFRETSVNEYKK